MLDEKSSTTVLKLFGPFVRIGGGEAVITSIQAQIDEGKYPKQVAELVGTGSRHDVTSAIHVLAEVLVVIKVTLEIIKLLREKQPDREADKKEIADEVKESPKVKAQVPSDSPALEDLAKIVEELTRE